MIAVALHGFQILSGPNYNPCRGSIQPPGPAKPQRRRFMEVYPPHKPIHSIKEFLVHLLAITIGLLIALGLEASVEWLHHRHLARDARENIFQEMRVNQQDVVRQLNALPADEKRLDEILSLVDDAQHGRPQKPIGGFMWTSVLLRDSAWNAASSTDRKSTR